ncbi:Adho120-like protein [Cryptophlebia peltastica nucleopolyhedrovirus]|uniref:Adho120-like protein n=1 Tax=Cryptophlebia peltastica nucleopolyhedrovirus TaxID=2304025 RepID=A0A346RNY9_9ABAC|nr:Adho120-like protein [Cryptophlebia peltastica nucleopolyhedrovirus]AXS67786.1 Adho120-like protein [Cryptophlebia peltastica nucleopolyhedrovirus]
MFKLCKYPVTLYLDDIKNEHASVSADRLLNKITYKYLIEDNKSKTVKVEIDSSNSYIQATFKYLKEHISIVNAQSPKECIYFDGFSSREDEAKTTPFILSKIKSLKENHNLISVKGMARAMGDKTILTVYINEAIMVSDVKWYNKLWFNHRKQEDSVDGQVYDNYLLSKINEEDVERNECELNVRNLANTTQWAPVNSKTGPLLLTIDIVFEYK